MSFDLDVFGDQTLTEKMLTGIIKQAISINRFTDNDRLTNQIKTYRRSLDIQQVDPLEQPPPPKDLARLYSTHISAKTLLKPLMGGISKSPSAFPKSSSGVKKTAEPYFASTAAALFGISVSKKSMRKAFDVFAGAGLRTAMVKGKIGNETPRGFVVESDGFQVFTKTSTEKPEAER